MANKRVPTKAQQRQNAMASKLGMLKEDTVLNSQISSEDRQERRSQAISEMAKQFSTSRETTRRKIVSERAKFRNTLRDKLFMESVYDMFMEGLVLDEDFKEKYAGNFYQLCQEMVGNLLESGQLTYKQIERDGSQIMKNILNLCEATADKEAKTKFDVEAADTKKDSKKILSEKNTKKEVTLSKEAKGDFDSKKSVDSRNIAGVVKEKVVQVIRDEQKQAEKQQTIDEEISNKLNPVTNSDATDYTTPVVDEGAEPEDDKGIKTDEGDAGGLSEGLRMIRRPNKVAQHSLFKSLQMNIANKNLKEMQAVSESVELNMDLVLAEAIAYYTLMETLYTTRLINPTASDLRSFAKELTLVKKK